jgi:Divergent InlB B-repeat domain
MRGDSVIRTAALLATPLVAALVVAWATVGAPGSAAYGDAAHGLRYVQTTRASSAEPLPAIRAAARASATWCGAPSQADLTPNTVAGFPVHWIYLVPADGADRFATFASLMQTDAEAIDAWWRSQDPTRTPRNDLTQLQCGQQLDLTTVRAQVSGAQLAGPDARFGAIFNTLRAGNFSSQFTKYVVYYDGPVTNADICGQGASDSSGFGLAVLYAQACTGVSTAAVVAHELLHAMGAVPRGAPHDCPPPNDGHTCDNVSDLMYPTIDASPLSSKLLDPGRDDYYGHSAGFGDSQDSPWLVQLDRQQPLTVTIAGAGQVSANVPGLRCAQTCTTTWNANTQLSLTPTPSAGNKLVRWGGACRGAGACTVTVAPGSAVSALFAPIVFRLNVSVGGKGTVRSSRTGITCRPRCSASFPSFVAVRLTATPAKGWRLRSWTGACRGTSRTCSVPMTAASSARAVFVRR